MPGNRTSGTEDDRRRRPIGDGPLKKKPPARAKGRGRPAGSGKENSGVRTVHVAARILDALAEFREPARVTDLARKLGMTMPTVSRHVATWRELGFVERADRSETYRLGSKLFSLGQAAAEQNTHVNVAYPFLLELRDQVHETVLLCTRVQEHATALLCLDSGLPTTLMVRPGAIFHLPYSPTARVLSAFATDSGAEARLTERSFDFSEQPGLTQRTFREKINDIRRNYYDFESEVRRTGLGAISAPIFDHSNNIAAAVTLIFPSKSMGEAPGKKVIAAIKTCAARVSAALGASAWSRAG
jgi:DNA-binding IclR family transcriptional regulator